MNNLFSQTNLPGELYVYVKDINAIPSFEKIGNGLILHCSVSDLQQVLTNYEVYSFERAFPIVDNFPQDYKYDLERVYLLKCSQDESALMEILSTDYSPYYDHVEVVPVFFECHTPNDYHLLDGTLGPNYALDIINAKDAWNITTGSPNTILGIVDNGFYVDLPELAPRVYSVESNTANDKTHGTFVAGIVAAATNNDIGMSSIGYQCKLALKGQGMGSPTVKILEFAIQGIKVVNFSIGSYTYSLVDESIINLAFDNGTLVVASAGNDNTSDYLYPASYPRAISVSSVDENLHHASSGYGIHNHNDRVDVCAAGYNVISIGKDANNQPIYYKSSGTSFSAPYVTGLVGLIYSINPNLHPELVTHIIKSTALDIYPQNPQYTGLLGTGLIDAYAAVQKAQLISNSGGNFDIYNGQNFTWEVGEPKVVNNYIRVHTGGSLTIKTDVFLRSNALITVDRGASLILDGALLSSYDLQNWEGIQVWGNNLLDQFPTSNQGYLKVSNNSTISNANRAIRIGKGTGQIAISSYGGGIVELESSLLLNNMKSIIFSPYRGNIIQKANRSYIRNNDFVWNKANISEMVFITLAGVHIADISGNRFLNHNWDEGIATENFGIGIYSLNSNFSIKSLNVGGNQIDSYFYHLRYGIKSEASNPVQSFSVENTTFAKVFNGIYANGSNGLRIVNNTFEPLNYPDFPSIPSSYGLYMNGCSGYKVEQNIFRNYKNVTQERKIIGIVVNNSGSAYNLINDNSISNLKIGILAQNQNRGSLLAYTGLVIKCNYFFQNKNDIAVTGDQNIAGYGIGYYQGTSHSTNSPAGNLFGHYPDWSASSDYHNELQNIVYVHHKPSSLYPELIPWYYTTSSISLIDSQQDYLAGISCLLTIPSEKEELLAFINEKESLTNNIQEELDDLVDQGNTPLLENKIFSSTPTESYEIYTDLMQNSSYTSETVLSTAIQKEEVLNNTMIRDVLVANPHASKNTELMNMLENRTNQLPEYMMAQIEDGFNTLSAKEALEMQIWKLRLEASIAEKELLYQYRFDTLLPGSIDSLCAFLSSRNRTDAFILLAFEYLRINDLPNAINALNSIPPFDLGVTELELKNKALSYMQFFNTLINQGRSIWELNYSDIDVLETLVVGDDLIASYARSLLIFNGMLTYNEPIILPEESLKASPSIRKNDDTKNDLLNIYPNPASTWITVEFNLKSTQHVNGHLEITDATGRIAKTIGLNDVSNSIVVDLTNLQKGIYFCSLKTDKQLFSCKKLTVY